MTIHTYEIGSDDDIQFTRSIVKKLPRSKSIPADAAEINLNTADRSLKADIEAVYGKVLKHYSVFIDEDEIVYFEEK